MSNSVWPYRRQPTRLRCPWDPPGKSTGVGCHCLLRICSWHNPYGRKQRRTKELFLKKFLFLLYFALQYCIGFAIHWHESSTGIHEFPIPPTSHPISSLWIIPVHQPQASYIEHRLAIHFLHDSIHVSMSFSQIIPPSSSPTESKNLFYTSVSLFAVSHSGLLLPSF